MLQRLRQRLAPRHRRGRLRPGTRGQATRRLRLLLCTSLLLLSLPLGLLLQRVYRQLAREVMYQYRSAAEEVVSNINQRLADVLQTEEQRPFDDYSFLKVTTSTLFKISAIAASPLSELPPQSAVPGVLGYFQINPDGTLQSPVLPELDEEALASNADRFGFGSSELTRRLALRNRLGDLLLAGVPVTERRRRQRSTTPPVAPAPPLGNMPTLFQDALEREAPAEKRSTQANVPSEADTTGKPALTDPRLARQEAPPWTETQPQPLPPSAIPQKLANSRASAYRERRKEQVALPEQATVSQVQEALDKLSSRDASLAPATGRLPEPRKPAESPAGKKERTVNILTFEGEVDPFQCTALGSEHLVFFRKAWRNGWRYIQGFVVDKNLFLQTLIDTPLGATALSQTTALTAQTQGTTLYTRAPMPLSYDDSTTLAVAPPGTHAFYRASLEAPLDLLDVAFSAWTIPRSSGATVVDALALTLILLLLASHYGLYRLGLQQIALAVQRSDFVSAVSHELRTPLTAIRMYGEMLREGWVQDEARRQSYYDFIFFESERLSRLIANVLQLARLTNQDAPLELRPYSLHQLLDLVYSKIATQAEAAGFELCFCDDMMDKTLASATVLADEDAFVQICINLVDNALKFSAKAAQKRLDVGLRPHTQAHQAVVFVRDYGPGVAPDQMQRIFQLFYRAEDELTRQTKGTGIGLALVKALASKMQAQVALQNHTPGAEFQLIMAITPAA